MVSIKVSETSTPLKRIFPRKHSSSLDARLIFCEPEGHKLFLKVMEYFCLRILFFKYQFPSVSQIATYFLSLCSLSF